MRIWTITKVCGLLADNITCIETQHINWKIWCQPLLELVWKWSVAARWPAIAGFHIVGDWVWACVLWDMGHNTHIARKSTLNFTTSSSLVLIKPILDEIQPFKNSKFYYEIHMGVGHRTNCLLRPAIHIFLSKFFIVFEWLYLVQYWLKSHQTWGFCKARCALSGCGSVMSHIP